MNLKLFTSYCNFAINLINLSIFNIISILFSFEKKKNFNIKKIDLFNLNKSFSKILIFL